MKTFLCESCAEFMSPESDYVFVQVEYVFVFILVFIPVCCFVCNFVGILCYSFYFHNHVLLGVPFNCPRSNIRAPIPKKCHSRLYLCLRLPLLPRLSLCSVSQIVQLECALYRFLYRSQSTAPTMSLTSINNFFFFSERNLSPALPLSLSVYTHSLALFGFSFLIFGYI